MSLVRDAGRNELIGARTFAIYGLGERWTGRRWLGGWGGPTGAVDRIELAHGDIHKASEALIRVETLSVRSFDYDRAEASAAQSLARHLWHEGAEHDVVRSAFTASDPTASWDDLTLVVDDVDIPFRQLATGSWWVALGRVGPSLVAIQAREIDPAEVALVAIADVAPYLADDGTPRGPTTS